MDPNGDIQTYINPTFIGMRKAINKTLVGHILQDNVITTGRRVWIYNIHIYYIYIRKNRINNNVKLFLRNYM